jgi:mitochondrial import receptor subunit TOM40
MGETQSRPAVSGSDRRGGGGGGSVYSNVLMANSLLQGAAAAVSVTKCEESAASRPLPPTPPLPTSSSGKETGQAPPPPAPPSAEDDDAIAQASKLVSAFAHPGQYEQAVSDGKRVVMVDTFDGFRCDINKQVSPFMAAIHSFHLGTSMIPDGRKSSYSFLTQVADESSLLMARVDPARGSADCRVHKGLLGGLALLKVQASVSQEGQGDQLLGELDVNGMTWAGNLKYGSMGGGLMYGMNFMQTVHPNVSMGGEGMYLTANQNFLSSYAVKVNWQAAAAKANENLLAPTTGASARQPGMPAPDRPGQSMVCVNYGTAQGAVTVNYKQVVAPNRLTVGAELQFSPLSLDSHAVLAAEYKWQRSKLNLAVDGTGKLQSVFEAKIGMAPGSPSIMFSADVDHLHDDMRFGFGITLDS